MFLFNSDVESSWELFSPFANESSTTRNVLKQSICGHPALPAPASAADSPAIASCKRLATVAHISPQAYPDMSLLFYTLDTFLARCLLMDSRTPYSGLDHVSLTSYANARDARILHNLDEAHVAALDCTYRDVGRSDQPPPPSFQGCVILIRCMLDRPSGLTKHEADGSCSQLWHEVCQRSMETVFRPASRRSRDWTSWSCLLFSLSPLKKIPIPNCPLETTLLIKFISSSSVLKLIPDLTASFTPGSVHCLLVYFWNWKLDLPALSCFL